MTKSTNENWGGKRNGAGRPPKPEDEKLQFVAAKIAPHVLEKLEKERKKFDLSKSKFIEKLILEFNL
jgi:hypothetical protein